jgi:tRNA pseudouridine55 synthase
VIPLESDGLLLVNKPSGPTSHDIVDGVRRATGLRRVGHAGTLDPLASGLLPLVLGRATRLVRFLPDAPKTYVGTFRLGRTTDTDDRAGEITSEHTGPLPAPEQVEAAARELERRRLQLPPAYSARRVKGRRLYELARKGVPVDAAPAEVRVTRFEPSRTAEPGTYEFLAEVSAGTYIRGLVRDLGRDLGCGGVLESLIRTIIGPLRLEDALPWTPQAPPEKARVLQALIPVERMPLAPPPLALVDAAAAHRFTRGGSLAPPEEAPDSGLVRVLAAEGVLLGIGEIRDGRLRPRVVIAPSSGSPSER